MSGELGRVSKLLKMLLEEVDGFHRSLEQLRFDVSNCKSDITNIENTISHSFPVACWEDYWPPSDHRDNNDGDSTRT